MSSKIGLHITPTKRDGFGDFLRKLRAAGVELPGVHVVDDFGVAVEIKAILPNTRVIGRVNDLRGQHLGEWQIEWNADPRGAAEEYYAKVKPIWDNNPAVDTWGTLNEVNNPFYPQQAEFYIRMMELSMHPLCLWNSSVGTPEYFSNDPVPYESVLFSCRAAKASELPHVLGLHEYAFVTDLLQDAYKNYELGPHLVLRYRRLAAYLKEQNALIPIVLTEVGQNGGYRFVDNEPWMVDMAWYDSEVRKDDAIEFVASWNLGDWANANIQSALPHLSNYLIAEHTAPPTTPPSEPTPPEPPTPEPPEEDGCRVRVPYVRTYHWFKRNAPEAAKDAIWRLAKEKGATAGSSADDALFGAEALKKVTGIFYGLSDSEREEYKAWKEREYPLSNIVFKAYPNSEPEPPPPEPLPEPFTMVWPTDYEVYTQRFGARPEYYEQFGLPGHEGVDIRCPSGGNVYACADGVVYQAGWIRPDHPYGNAIRIMHKHNGQVYKTVYAHLQGGSARVNVGDIVEAGQLIGLGDSTGNVDGSHLHLTLKKRGANNDGYGDIINPEPFLPDIDDTPPPPSPPEPTHVPVAMLHLGATGLHPNDPNGSFMTDLRMLRDANMQGFVFTTNSDIDPDGLGILLRDTGIKPENVIVRLFMPGSDPNIANPARYVELHRAWIRHGLSHGVRKFQLWNEPNLDAAMVAAGKIKPRQMEWPHDAARFAEVYHDVAARLRNEYGDPNIKIGFPPMSPQDNAKNYYDASWRIQGIRLPDWYSIHSYFSADGTGQFGIDSLDGGLYWQNVIEWLPDKFMPIWLTEFADNGDGPDIDRARRTAAYFARPDGEWQWPIRVRGVACYISQDANWPKQEWASNSHMVAKVAAR